MTDNDMYFRGNLWASLAIALVALTIAAIMLLTPSRAGGNDDAGAEGSEQLLRAISKALDSQDPTVLVRLSGGEQLATLMSCSSDPTWDELDAELAWMRTIRRIDRTAASNAVVDQAPQITAVAKGDRELDCTASRPFERALFSVEPKPSDVDSEPSFSFIAANVVDERWYLVSWIGELHGRTCA